MNSSGRSFWHLVEESKQLTSYVTKTKCDTQDLHPQMTLSTEFKYTFP